MSNEPISLSVAIGGLLSTGVAMIAIFVPNLTPETQAVIIAFGNSLILTGSILWARARTTPTSNPVLPEGTAVTVTTAVGQADKVTTL